MIRCIHSNCRGNSLVEMVLLVPLYALIIAGAMLLGEIGLVIVQSHEGNEYAGFTPGDQSETAGLRDSGVLKAAFWTPYEGALDLREQTTGQVPRQDEIDEIFEEMMKVQYWTSAHGHYTFRNGRLVYEISKQKHARRMADARYVMQHELQDDNIPMLTTETLDDYMGRSRVHTEFNFVPKYLTWSKFELEGVSIKSQYQTAYRDELVREVGRQFGAPNAPIERLTPKLGGGGSLSDYPQFENTEDFWEPN